jgi:hypothetical protein
MLGFTALEAAKQKLIQFFSYSTLYFAVHPLAVFIIKLNFQFFFAHFLTYHLFFFNIFLQD